MTAVNAVPRRVANLDIGTMQDGYIIFQPQLDRVYYLNGSAVLILELSNGRNTVPEIAGLVQQAFALPEAPLVAVRNAVAQLSQQGLLEPS